MAYRIYVALIQLVNIGILWFASALAIEGKMPVFWVGLFGVCLFTLLAFRLISIEGKSAAITVSLGTLPVMWFLSMCFFIVYQKPIPVFSGLAIFIPGWLLLISKSQNRIGVSKPWRINFTQLTKTKFSVFEKLGFYCVSLFSICVGIYVLIQQNT